jgi:hypothetical protein
MKLNKVNLHDINLQTNIRGISVYINIFGNPYSLLVTITDNNIWLGTKIPESTDIDTNKMWASLFMLFMTSANLHIFPDHKSYRNR